MYIWKMMKVSTSLVVFCGVAIFWFTNKATYVNYADRHFSPKQQMESLSINGIHSNNDRNKSLLGLYRAQSRTDTDKNSQYFTLDPNVFEPDVYEDIQTVDSEIPRIPHILHFIFITGIKGKHGIPSIYRNNIMSFLHFNPNWTFYFWSDVSGREKIATRQPAFLSTYDKYTRVMHKANVLRYVLLYEFGGVYADLDMHCMRPLDRATMKYACILTPEAFEHSAILYQMTYFFSTALMLCRPKHPFFKQVIESLLKTTTLDNVGPKFFTKQYNVYNKILPNETYRTKSSLGSNSPYFYQGPLEEDHNDALYVANTQYFMSSFDSGQNSYFRTRCTKIKLVPKIVNRGCNLWKKRDNNKTNNPFSFTDHGWKHMYSITNTTEMIPIQSIIPQIKQYNVSSLIPV